MPKNSEVNSLKISEISRGSLSSKMLVPCKEISSALSSKQTSTYNFFVNFFISFYTFFFIFSLSVFLIYYKISNVQPLFLTAQIHIKLSLSLYFFSRKITLSINILILYILRQVLNIFKHDFKNTKKLLNSILVIHFSYLFCCILLLLLLLLLSNRIELVLSKLYKDSLTAGYYCCSSIQLLLLFIYLEIDLVFQIYTMDVVLGILILLLIFSIRS